MTKPRTPAARAKLIADAINRSARSLIQAIVAEVVLVVYPEVVRMLQSEGVEWDIDAWTSLGRFALFAAIAYVHRRFVDPSKVPSLLPPADPGIPAEPPA